MFARTEEDEQRLIEIGQISDKLALTADDFDKNNEFVEDHILTLKKENYTVLTLPKSSGGKGADLYQFLLLQERLAQGCASTALAIGWHLGLIYDLNQDNSWNSDVFTYVMNEVKNGKLLNAAATEAATGSPTRGGRPQTTATKVNRGWQMNGRKTFTTLAPALDFFLVTAAIKNSSEVGQFLIPASFQGVGIEETWDSIAMRGTGSHDLVLENVLLPENYLLSTLNSKNQKVNGWLLHIPACYLGIAIAAHHEAIAFATSYIPNSVGHPISELPNIQRLIGESELALKTARHFLYSVADKWEKTNNKSKLICELAAVKHSATNTALEVVDRSMRIVGARSLSLKSPMQRYYRDVRAGLHNPPMDDATISLLAKTAITQK